MEKKDFQEMLGMVTSMMKIKYDLEQRIKECQEGIKNNEKEGEDDEKEDIETDEIVISLQKDYDAMMRWAFGDEYETDSKSKSIMKWCKLHPNLNVPRALIASGLSCEFVTLTAMFDIIPLYLAHNKSKE